MTVCAGRFAERRATVTGGASGLGRAVAGRIVDEGGADALWDVDADALAAAAAATGAARAHALDASPESAVGKAVAAMLAALGGCGIPRLLRRDYRRDRARPRIRAKR